MTIKQELIDEILVNFYSHNIRWRVNGHLQEPSEDDVRRVLDRLRDAVYDGVDQTQAGTGGILVKNDDGHLDVYLHIGEL